MVSGLLLVAAVVVVAVVKVPERGFPWGIHLVTVPAVLLLGVIIGWFMRDRQFAEEQAQQAVDADTRDDA